LPSVKLSGLKEARTVLANTPGINFTIFDDRDVVRHRLVQRIILAYEAFNRGDDTMPSGPDKNGTR
jgi:phosphate starvation-inducible PhoH-like protein